MDKIKPFHDHPFHLYQGERLDDMVESIREHGVLNPVIVRHTKTGFEMLAGHNRANAAKLAGYSGLFIAVVSSAVSNIDTTVFHMIDQAVFVVDPSAIFSLQVAG